MKAVIWYHSEEKMKEKIYGIINKYKAIGCFPQMYAQGGRGCSRTIGFIKSNDIEDIWTLIPDTTKFYTKERIKKLEGFNIAYIDIDINKKFRKEVIFPLLKCEPYQAYRYF